MPVAAAKPQAVLRVPTLRGRAGPAIEGQPLRRVPGPVPLVLASGSCDARVAGDPGPGTTAVPLQSAVPPTQTAQRAPNPLTSDYHPSGVAVRPLPYATVLGRR